VLVKTDDAPRSDVVDGQQRLTTVTLRLAAISAALAGDEEWGREFDKFVREPGAKALKLAPKPRLFPRKKDQAFFEKYVQTPGGFPDLFKYFQSKSGVSPYANTTQVLSRGQWTVAEVEARQQELLDVFRKGWQLG
jgi:hypothetical protein